MDFRALENKHIYIILGLGVLCIPLAYLYVCILFISQLIHKDYTILRNIRNEKPLLMVLISLIISIIFVKFKLISLAVGSLNILCLLTVSYILTSRESVDIDSVLKLMYILTIIVCIIGIIQIINPNYVMPKKWVDLKEYNLNKRMYSTFFNPNILGFYLNMIIIILITDIRNIQSYKEIGLLRGCTLLLSLICLFYTFSRTGWISLVAVLFMAGIVIDKKYLKFAVMIAIFLVMCDHLSGIGRVDVSKLPEDSSLAYRIELWKAGIRIARDNIITGIGFGTFYKYTPLYSDVVKKYIEHCHNIYLQLVIEMGLVGVVAVIGSFIVFIKKLIVIYLSDKQDATVTALLIIITMALVHGLVDSVLFTPQIMFVMASLVSIVTTVNKQKLNTYTD